MPCSSSYFVWSMQCRSSWQFFVARDNIFMHNFPFFIHMEIRACYTLDMRKFVAQRTLMDEHGLPSDYSTFLLGLGCLASQWNYHVGWHSQCLIIITKINYGGDWFTVSMSFNSLYYALMKDMVYSVGRLAQHFKVWFGNRSVLACQLGVSLRGSIFGHLGVLQNLVGFNSRTLWVDNWIKGMEKLGRRDGNSWRFLISFCWGLIDIKASRLLRTFLLCMVKIIA